MNAPCWIYMLDPSVIFLGDEPQWKYGRMEPKEIKNWLMIYLLDSNSLWINQNPSHNSKGFGSAVTYPVYNDLSPGATRVWGPFLESPETFPAHFGWHNSLFIFKTKATRGTKLYTYFNYYSLYNIWEYQLYRISLPEFYKWLFGPEKFSELSRNGPQMIWLQTGFSLTALLTRSSLCSDDGMAFDKIQFDYNLFLACVPFRQITIPLINQPTRSTIGTSYIIIMKTCRPLP